MTVKKAFFIVVVWRRFHIVRGDDAAFCIGLLICSDCRAPFKGLFKVHVDFAEGIAIEFRLDALLGIVCFLALYFYGAVVFAATRRLRYSLSLCRAQSVELVLEVQQSFDVHTRRIQDVTSVALVAGQQLLRHVATFKRTRFSCNCNWFSTSFDFTFWVQWMLRLLVDTGSSLAVGLVRTDVVFAGQTVGLMCTLLGPLSEFVL
mmetsp:Transcript_113109/g.243679  ORF Transcript_113109/g.243679 Transcript_113109/m.243679 type:complete len:204 (+) Transcript_113109:116-727(+)